VWAAGVDLIGAPLELSWSAAGETRTYFTGRVGAVEVSPHTATLDNVRTQGALVSLSCTSLLADLGQPAARRNVVAGRDPRRPPGPHRHPRRRARVASIATRAAWDAAPLAALDPSKTIALDHLKALFDACGADRYTYDPHTKAVGYLARRTFPDPTPLARLTPTRPGWVCTSPPPAGPSTGITSATPAAAGKDLASRLTRVVLSYVTGTTTAQVTVPLSGIDESAVGVRAATVATAHTDVTQATAAANDLAALAAGEATGWALDAMQWKPAPADSTPSPRPAG
jgi:hypothetical protein